MKAVIALGANIGNPKENLDIAVALLKEATDFQSISSYYSTAPVGGPEQPDYLNAVCIVESELPATDLLPQNPKTPNYSNLIYLIDNSISSWNLIIL